MNKLRVGVFMGGKSIEKEVSFNSGRTICDHLDTTRFDVIPIFQTTAGELFLLPLRFVHRGKTTDFEHRLQKEAQQLTWDELKHLIDFMYIAVHGRYAEDGTIQGFLEILGIPYLGSKVFASALSMDKVMQKQFLKKHDIAVARDIVVSIAEVNNLDIKKVCTRMQQQKIDFPCIVKSTQEGSSLGVYVAHNQKELETYIKKASTIFPKKQQSVLIEEKLNGMEFSCITLVDYKTNSLLPLPPTEIVPEKNTHIFDYDQKYMPGRATKFTPARCSNEVLKNIQDTCAQVMRLFDIKTISRIDGFVTEDNHIVIVDPNTLSGMGPASFLFREAAEIDMSHTQLINHLIDTELHQYGLLNEKKESQNKEQKTMKKKIRVAVLMGGNSNEREISLESGRNVCYKLSPHKYEVIPLFVNNNMELYHLNQSLLVRNSTKEINSLLDKKTKITWHELPSLCDFVFIGLHGGHGENGNMQGTLEMLELPYNGSGILTSSLCNNKYKTNQFLSSLGFDVPQNILINKNDWQKNKTTVVETIIKKIGLPLIAKPHDDGCSVMVQKAQTKKEITSCIETIFADNKKHVLIEECILGMELTVGVIGNGNPTVLPPSQTVVANDILSIHEKFLPGAGENQTPAPLNKKQIAMVQQIIGNAYQKLSCTGYARIDCFYQSAQQSPTRKERIIILEVNTLPALTPATCIFHQAAEIGMRPMDFIDQIIELGLQKHTQTKDKSVITIDSSIKNKTLQNI